MLFKFWFWFTYCVCHGLYCNRSWALIYPSLAPLLSSLDKCLRVNVQYIYAATINHSRECFSLNSTLFWINLFNPFIFYCTFSRKPFTDNRICLHATVHRGRFVPQSPRQPAARVLMLMPLRASPSPTDVLLNTLWYRQ